MAFEIGTYYLPSVSYKDTITAIIENAGYSVSGDFYDNDATFNNMVIIYSRKNFLNTTLKLNEALSTDILQSDFIKDFLVKFGAFLKFSNNNIEIVTLESILTNTGISTDWTSKRVKNKKDVIQYNWNGLSKVNNFLYPDNTLAGDEYIVATRLVNGSLNVTNDLLSGSSDLYTSIFYQPNFILDGSANPPIENAIVTLVGAIGCVTSSVWDAVPSSYVFTNIPKPMLALLTDRYTSSPTEPAVKYNSTSRTDYKVARFMPAANRTGPSISWNQHDHTPNAGLLDVYYKSMQRIFTDRIITTSHEYNLTDMDIYSLDLITPIFDDGNYYLINKIVNYVSGKTTRVELLKI